MKSKLLVVVDMQNDFITGSLGTPEAEAIVPNVIQKIESWDGDIVATLDTHGENYLETMEGKFLPVPHCIFSTEGHCIESDVYAALQHKSGECRLTYIQKPTFGSTALPEIIRGKNYESIEIIGLCTDICVVSNTLILKANYPETEIIVDASCCAGVAPETHKAALATMKMCHIKIVGE